MPIKKLTFLKSIAILNVLMISILYIDFYFPVELKVVEKFSSFSTNSVKVYGKRGKTSYQYNNYINSKSGKSYYLIKLPVFEDKFQVDKEFTITKTYILGKFKKIDLEKNNIFYVQSISFLNNDLIKILCALALIISLSSFFYSNTILDILFAFSTVFIYYVIFSYLFLQ